VDKTTLPKVFVFALLVIFALAEGGASDQPQALQMNGRVEQVFAVTNSGSIEVESWTAGPKVLAQLALNLSSPSFLIITFSATGATDAHESSQPTIACMIDGTTPCEPGEALFLLSNLWDSRSFTWVIRKVGRGMHTIRIDATMATARPTPPSRIRNNTLVVEAARF
jgi:hypothetical protein